MRKTSELPLETASNLVAAHNFAAQIGRPLNQFITITWSQIDGVGNPQQRWARLLVCLRHWLIRRGIELTIVWVHEHDKAKALHTHALVHVPHGIAAALARQLWHWAGIYLAAHDHTQKPVDMRPDNGGRIRYVTKDVDRLHHRELGIHPQYSRRQSTRPITGKRAGVSQNLGPAARARFAAQTSVAA